MSAKLQKSLAVVRNFNEKFKIGQKVKYQSIEYKMWSPAGLNKQDEPCVFLDSKNLQEPIVLADLEIEGWKNGKSTAKK